MKLRAFSSDASRKSEQTLCARLWMILAFGEYDFVPKPCEVLLRFQARTNAFNDARQAVHLSMECESKGLDENAAFEFFERRCSLPQDVNHACCIELFFRNASGNCRVP